MREIKFRAWDKYYRYMSHKVMVGNVWDEDNYHAHMIWIDGEDVDYECESGWVNFDEYSNIEIMQFTGLLDKNGTEIYEGDVLFHPIQGARKVIYPFNENVASYGLQNKDGWLNTLQDAEELYEIIGNIYENPGLLGDNQ